MTLDMLLYSIRERRDILVSEEEIWWSSHGPDRHMAQALRRHKRGVRTLLKWASVEVCPSRDLHRRYYRYSGAGRFACELCERLKGVC